MKIQLHFKTPDVLHYAMDGLTPEQKDEVEELARRRWLEYSECITVEIDTKAETCVVVENS